MEFSSFFLHSERQPGWLPFLGEGILLWGNSKIIYNVLGGFYRYYNTMTRAIGVHKDSLFFDLFLFNLYTRNSVL